MAKDKTAWFYRGQAGIDKAKQVGAEQKARRDKQGPLRFWLPNEESAKIVLLDTPDFFVMEHNLKIGGKYYNFFTCLGEKDTCPPCESSDSPSLIAVGSVLNTKPYTDKEGTVHKVQKQLFVLKGKAQEKIINQIKKRKDLALCVYEATRGASSTECSTGEDFEYLGKLTEEKLKKLIPAGQDESWLQPFDYETLFAPRDAKELRQILGMADPVGASEEGEGDPLGDGELAPEVDGDVSIDQLV